MNDKTSEENFLKEKTDKILRGFRTVIDFYRMEYSENLTVLFNETGFLLIIRLFYGGYFEKEQEMSVSESNKYKLTVDLEKLHDQSQEMMDFFWDNMVRKFENDSEGNGKFSGLRGFQFTIRKSSVLRHMLEITEEICELWEVTGDKDALYDVICKIHKSCAGGREDKGRYTLPESVVAQILQLLNPEWESGIFPAPIAILDPQYGSGEMLIAAGRYLKHTELYGEESNEQLRISAQILSIFAGLTIHDVKEDFLKEASNWRYDLVVANPIFSNENVEDKLRELPDELWNIKGKYNLLIVRSLLALKVNGYAAIIVPDSFLFSSRNESKKIRRWILETYCLDMILSLPENMFDSNSTVRSSVLIIRNSFMRYVGQNYIDHILFYQMNADPGSRENEEEFKELLRIRNQRDYYYRQWREKLQDFQENYSDVITPIDWSYSNFWFADYDTVDTNKVILLPDHYRPIEKIKLQFEAPDKLLEELIGAQEDILDDMYELLREVQKI
ncbi:MAG: N-6 DNA methylase [Lachnospiraceae bacterium]|nr:N-6 DNA methylase [Lachnospiraceae bacterium]